MQDNIYSYESTDFYKPRMVSAAAVSSLAVSGDIIVAEIVFIASAVHSYKIESGYIVVDTRHHRAFRRLDAINRDKVLLDFGIEYKDLVFVPPAHAYN